MTLGFVNVSIKRNTRKREPEIGPNGSSQTRQNPQDDGYEYGFGLQQSCGSGLWKVLEQNQSVYPVQTQTVGGLSGPVANTRWRWRSRQRWCGGRRWCSGRWFGRFGWRCAGAYVPPASLRILCCASLAWKAVSCMIFIKHCWVSFYCSLHRFMAKRLNASLLLFSDFSTTFRH